MTEQVDLLARALRVACKALAEISEDTYGCPDTMKHRICHPEGCESPQVAYDALTEINTILKETLNCD